MTSSRAMIAPSGMPLAIPLARQMMSGSTPQCSTANSLPVRPMPDLHLVGDQQDAVPVAQLAQGRQEARRRHVVAALALDRLDEDGRHLVRRGDALEDRLLDLPDAGARRPRRAVGAAARDTATWWMSGTSGEKPRRWTSFEPDSDMAP